MNYFIALILLLPPVAAVGGYALSVRCPKAREAFFICAAAVETALIGYAAVCVFTGWQVQLCVPGAVGMGLSFRLDAFRAAYCLISAFMWLMTLAFSKEYMAHQENRDRYYFFCMITLCGVLGVFMSDDLFTTFCFFELMSFASYPLVIHEQNRDAMKAGETYLGVAVISGMILLVGLFILYYRTGTLSFELLREYFAAEQTDKLTFAGGILALLGFGAKAGMYPLHIWLPQAHPVAPAPASALLSGILTKTGVFGIIVISSDVFSGNAEYGRILLVLAVITMFFGAFLALFSVNLKRTLACSSMSQIGFILVGIAFMNLLGKEGALAQSGAFLHMINHSFIKLTLFMAAGVVAMNIHALDLNDIKGFGRKKPFLMTICLVGTLGIAGVPLFNGYASKTMLHESITEFIQVGGLSGAQAAAFKAVEWIFLLSGALTVAYMTKLFVCVFIEKNNDAEKQKMFDAEKDYASPLTRAVLAISAIPIVVIGLLPNAVNAGIVSAAYEFFGVERLNENVKFFSWESLEGAAISIVLGAAIYLLAVRKVFIRNNRYIDLWPQGLDMEKLIYRPLTVDATRFFINSFVRYIADGVETVLVKGTLLFILYVVRMLSRLFDVIILLLNKTVLKAHAYRYKEEPLAMKIGRLISKVTGRKSTRAYADKLGSLSSAVSAKVKTEYNSFSFTFAMISLGIIIVFLFALFR